VGKEENGGMERQWAHLKDGEGRGGWVGAGLMMEWCVGEDGM
jgi:hypothetical protein